MTDRIKLTEDDFELELRGLDVIKICYTSEDTHAKKIKQQILDDQEKAKIYKDAFELWNKSRNELLIENKQLKDIKRQYFNQILHQDEKLEKIKELHDNVNLLESDSQIIDILNLLQEILDSQEKE